MFDDIRTPRRGYQGHGHSPSHLFGSWAHGNRARSLGGTPWEVTDGLFVERTGTTQMSIVVVLPCMENNGNIS